MIETIKDLKHNRSSYESLRPSHNHSAAHSHGRHASSSTAHAEPTTACSDSLTTTKAAVLANAGAIYGPCRSLDIITFASTHSHQISAAIVEHNPHGRSYIHCCSAKEHTRLAAVEHLLVITEDLMQRLMDKEGITSSGWLPATPQSQHAAAYNQSTLSRGFSNGSLPNLMNLMKVESASSKASTPQGERQSTTGLPPQAGVVPPRDVAMGPQQQAIVPQHQAMLPQQQAVGPQQQAMGPQQQGPQHVMASPQQAVAPQPTRAGRVQWMMGSEG